MLTEMPLVFSYLVVKADRKVFEFTFFAAKLPRGLHQDDIKSLTMLQDAISILFSFKRMGEVEEEFCKDVDCWLEKLVSFKLIVLAVIVLLESLAGTRFFADFSKIECPFVKLTV